MSLDDIGPVTCIPDERKVLKQNLLDIVTGSYIGWNLGVTFQEYYVVTNSTLTRRYEEAAAQIRGDMSTTPEKKSRGEKFVFSVETKKSSIALLASEGRRCHQEKNMPCLGDEFKGVNVYKNADLLLTWAARHTIHDNRPIYLIVYKLAVGRVKYLSEEEVFVRHEPLAHYNTTMSSDPPRTGENIGAALLKSAVYVYEYKSGIPCLQPRHLHPFAIVECCPIKTDSDVIEVQSSPEDVVERKDMNWRNHTQTQTRLFETHEPPASEQSSPTLCINDDEHVRLLMSPSPELPNDIAPPSANVFGYLAPPSAVIPSLNDQENDVDESETSHPKVDVSEVCGRQPLVSIERITENSENCSTKFDLSVSKGLTVSNAKQPAKKKLHMQSRKATKESEFNNDEAEVTYESDKTTRPTSLGYAPRRTVQMEPVTRPTRVRKAPVRYNIGR